MPIPAALAALRIREVMTREPICVPAETTLPELLRLLEEHEIGGVPVVRGDGVLAGVVSRSDLVRHSGESMAEGRGPSPRSPLEEFLEGSDRRLPEEGEEMDLEEAREAFGEAAVTVGEIMTPEPLTATSEESAAAAARRMAAAGVHRVVVVDAASRPVGIVTSLDLLRRYPGA